MSLRHTGTEPPSGTRWAAYDLLRDDARARLRAWTAPDAGQERLRRDFLLHLGAHPGAMAKSGPAAHFTGSVIVLDDALERVLLTHHRRARQWFQFGGHYEALDRSVWHAAAREANEESGIDGLRVLPDLVQLDRHALVGDFGHCREHLDIRFAAVAPAGVTPTASEESLAVRWWPRTSLPEGTADELRPLVDAAVKAVEAVE